MMGQLAAERDVESLQKVGGRSRCCLDAFLVASVIFLFVSVAAVAAVVVMERLPLHTEMLEMTGESPNYKGHNFAYVQATESRLLNCTMLFAERLHGESRSVGDYFRFNEDHSSLTPQREGNYFVYVNVNLTCVHKCSAGLLRLDVGGRMSCELRLPNKTDTAPVSKQCWTVQRLGTEGLQTDMTVFSEGQLGDWRLELETSGWGMFLVD